MDIKLYLMRFSVLPSSKVALYRYCVHLMLHMTFFLSPAAFHIYSPRNTSYLPLRNSQWLPWRTSSDSSTYIRIYNLAGQDFEATVPTDTAWYTELLDHTGSTCTFTYFLVIVQSQSTRTSAPVGTYRVLTPMTAPTILQGTLIDIYICMGKGRRL